MLLSQPLAMGTMLAPKAEAAEIKSGELISFEGIQANKIMEQTATPAEQDLVDITDNKLEEGDFKILSGDGSLTYNADGSVTYKVTSTQKIKLSITKWRQLKMVFSRLILRLGISQ